MQNQIKRREMGFIKNNILHINIPPDHSIPHFPAQNKFQQRNKHKIKCGLRHKKQGLPSPPETIMIQQPTFIRALSFHSIVS